MNKKNREKILVRFKKNNPKPKIELTFNSVFELLISVLLSAQSTDNRVNQITNILYKIANTPQKILKVGIKRIKKIIKPIGLYNIKSKNIIRISKILVDNYDGIIPEDRKFLESLPGVGRKTANLILNVAFDWPTIAVDRHVFRVCNRTSFVYGKNVLQVEKKMLNVVPKKFKKNCHSWFVLHGRYVCKAKKPMCNICFIEDLCEFKEKNLKINIK